MEVAEDFVVVIMIGLRGKNMAAEEKREVSFIGRGW
jgi:hypothetical protein